MEGLPLGLLPAQVPTLWTAVQRSVPAWCPTSLCASPFSGLESYWEPFSAFRTYRMGWEPVFWQETLQSGYVTPHWFICKPPIFQPSSNEMGHQSPYFEIIHTLGEILSSSPTHAISRNYYVLQLIILSLLSPLCPSPDSTLPFFPQVVAEMRCTGLFLHLGSQSLCLNPLAPLKGCE